MLETVEYQLLDHHLARAQGDDAALALGDGLGGVGHQVHDHLLHLRGIAHDLREHGRQVVADQHLLGQGHGEQFGHLLHQAVHVHPHDGHLALARVGQHLPGQVRRAHGGLLDLVQVRLGRAVLEEHHGRQVAVAQDAGEQVVEVVRDPPGKHAQALQLLGLAQGLLGQLALGDVGADGHELHRPAVGPQERHDGGVHPVVAAVLGPVADLPLPHPARQDGAPEVGEEGLGVVLAVDDAVVLPQQFLPPVFGDGAELVVHVGDLAPGVGDRHDGVLVQGPLEGLQLLHRRQFLRVFLAVQEFPGHGRIHLVPGRPGELPHEVDGVAFLVQAPGVDAGEVALLGRLGELADPQPVVGVDEVQEAGPDQFLRAEPPHPLAAAAHVQEMALGIQGEEDPLVLLHDLAQQSLDAHRPRRSLFGRAIGVGHGPPPGWNGICFTNNVSQSQLFLHLDSRKGGADAGRRAIPPRPLLPLGGPGSRP